VRALVRMLRHTSILFPPDTPPDRTGAHVLHLKDLKAGVYNWQFFTMPQVSARARASPSWTRVLRQLAQTGRIVYAALDVDCSHIVCSFVPSQNS
jgi:hypothetical protein